MTLIGSKPDVDVPDLPTPWTSDGDAILDANGRYVLAVNPGITHLDRHLIAKVVAATINLAHGRRDDNDPTTLHYSREHCAHIDSDGDVWDRVGTTQEEWPPLADAMTVSADDLDHTKPNPLARASQGLDPFPLPDPLGHVLPGDPDPTAKRVSGADCDAEWDALLCTREAGHPGHHIAGGEDEVVAVWRDDV
ncbi:MULTISPECIES: hypothetical protein [Prauserella salsuginis group]|uniref:Uncharacterized protein n=1 Tax=Prauserella salsuginis TaxID=387889 RepID=A0ABW6G5V6_9PSEU|nr:MULTISPECIES: hypothetical protein [Prauserella salsuginis group]MCR3719157.1 hypothetical protein [Prauserella flava]MCR3735830.1 hypothetical protein [Prauserella salsuginis]